MALCLWANGAAAFDPWLGDLGKDNPAYVRVLTYNMERQYPGGTATRVAAADRVLAAIQPDVVSFQELLPGTGPALATRLSTVLGGQWNVHTGQSDGFIVNGLATRWGLSLTRADTSPPSEVRGTTLALVDVPSTMSANRLYFGAIHFKCCSGTAEDARRQRHADAITAWLFDARTPGGTITLAPNTPMMIAGDFNFGNSFSPQPRLTMIQGTIQNTAIFGPPVKADWDNSDLLEPLPVDPFTFGTSTFSSTSPGSRLDRFYLTDSVATLAQAKILNTATMPSSVRTALGLLSNDTATASDHLPVFADYALAPVAVTEPLYRGVFVTEFQADPTAVSDENGEWFEVYNPADQPVNLDGWILRDSGSNYHVVRRAGGVWIQPRSHLVFAINGNSATNGGVQADYVFSNFRLANGADAVEIYRGSIKVDGLRYSGGAAGLEPANTTAGGAPTPGRARMMLGDYRNGPTSLWGDATDLYNTVDRGTPGQLNFVAPAQAQNWHQYN